MATLLLEGNCASSGSRLFIRRKIPELREEIARREAEARNHGNHESIVSAQDRHTESETLHTGPKIYGGYPSTDNPQTQKHEARMGQLSRRSSLQKLGDSDLINELTEMITGERGTKFRATAPSTVWREIYQTYEELPDTTHGLYVPLTLTRRNTIIDAVLEAEKHNK